MNPYLYPVLYILAMLVFIGMNLVLVGRVKSQIRRLTAEKTPIHRLKLLEEEQESQDIRMRTNKRKMDSNTAAIEDQAGQLQKFRARMASEMRKRAEIDLEKLTEYLQPTEAETTDNEAPQPAGPEIDPAYL